MNCDYCIEGYYLLIENNKKNCFKNDIKIPSNYFSKENEPNIYYKCYELCGSCYNEGNALNMNCKTCINNDTYEYDPYYKNCFPRISCINYYYYNIDKNNYISFLWYNTLVYFNLFYTIFYIFFIYSILLFFSYN